MKTKSNLVALLLATAMLLSLAACNSSKPAEPSKSPEVVPESPEIGDVGDTGGVEDADGLVIESSVELLYAKNFTIDNCKGGYKLISIYDEQRFLVVPEGAEPPSGLDEDIIVVQQPLSDMLVSSTPVTSLISAIGGLDHMTMVTFDIGSWYIQDVIDKMENGEIIFIGDQRTPDYEILSAKKPALVIYSTMLNSLPDVSEKLAELGIPVLVDQATYEGHPLARTEWVKLYGALFGLEEAAEEVFNRQVAVVDELTVDASLGKSAAIFYIISNGKFVVRNAGDYVVEMLRMAGGEYIFADMNPEDTGNTQMEGEAFFEVAYDADFIIYIHSMGGRPADLEALVAINPILGELKAVKEGNVWCTAPNFFQVVDTLGYMIKDINVILTNTDPELTELDYLFKLQ